MSLKPVPNDEQRQAIIARQPTAILRPQTFNELLQFAQLAARSGMVPRDYIGKPESIVIAVQMGSELGLAPMQALQNIAVISGRPAVWGDALPALCRQSAHCQDIEEWEEGEGEEMVAWCKAIRVGAKLVVRKFSVADAKKAGLWGKSGPWQQYPRRMLQMRARGFALRDAFPDVLKGLISVEEAADVPQDNYRDTFTGQTIDATAEPVTATTNPTKPRGTVKDYLDALEAELAQVLTMEALAQIGAREDVANGMDKFTGAALQRLTDLLDATRARLEQPPAEDQSDAAQPFLTDVAACASFTELSELAKRPMPDGRTWGQHAEEDLLPEPKARVRAARRDRAAGFAG